MDYHANNLHDRLPVAEAPGGWASGVMNLAAAIFAAVDAKDAVRVRELLERDAGLANAQNELRETPLHCAAAAGSLPIAELLLAYGADVDGRPGGGRHGPIVRAAERDHRQIARLLIASGADLAREGGQPVQVAGQRGHREMCRLLVDAGAIDALIQPPDARAIAVFRAARRYDPDGLAGVLRAMPGLERARDADGRTPLHAAAENGDTESAGVLIRTGADLHARDHRGETPFDRAVGAGHQEVVRLLLDAGAECDLFTAIEFGAVARIGVLLQLDPSLVNARCFERSALEYAITYCQKPVARLLLECGADDPGDRGRRFLDGAVIEDQDLTAAMVQRVSFQGAALQDVDFTGATLAHVSFRGARFLDASFANAEIDSATLSGLTIWGIEVVPLLRAELARRRKAERV